MRTPETPVSQDVTVNREVEGHYDENNNWVPGSNEKVADIEDANILPKAGRERATALQTDYESDYELIFGEENISFENDFSKIKAGDIAIDENDKEYKVVFPGKFTGVAYVADLKKK